MSTLTDTSKAYAVHPNLLKQTADPWPNAEDAAREFERFVAHKVASLAWGWNKPRPFPATIFCQQLAKPEEKVQTPPQAPEEILAQSPVYHPAPKRAIAPLKEKMTKRELVEHGHGRIVHETRAVGPLTYHVSRFVRYHGIPKLYHRVRAEYRLWRSRHFEQTALVSSSKSHPIF